MEHENKKKGKEIDGRVETRQEVPTVLNTKCCHPVEFFMFIHFIRLPFYFIIQFPCFFSLFEGLFGEHQIIFYHRAQSLLDSTLIFLGRSPAVRSRYYDNPSMTEILAEGDGFCIEKLVSYLKETGLYDKIQSPVLNKKTLKKKKKKKNCSYFFYFFYLYKSANSDRKQIAYMAQALKT